MLNVFLLRHGETAYNADGNRYCGRTDIDLTSKGIAQAEEIAKQLKDVAIDAVYASPLKRAYLTAQIATGTTAIKLDDRLIEIDFGTWEGKTKDEFVAANPQMWDDWIEDPSNACAGATGENGQQVVNRLVSFYEELHRNHAGQTVLVVGHNGTNRLFMAHKLGMNLKDYRKIVQENSSITMFELDDNNEFSLKKLNSKW